MKNQITLTAPDDFHVHFRQGDSLGAYAYHTARHFARAIIMPNTEPAIQNAADIVRYKQEILQALHAYAQQPSQNENTLQFIKQFEPLMTFKVYKYQTHEQIKAMKEVGVIAGKLYPQGATTNSEDGISELSEINHIFKAMEELDIILCIHGEDPHSFVLDREKDFLAQLKTIRSNFPKLKIVREHVTTKDAVDYIKDCNSPYLAATITTHHLLFTLDALLGGFLNPHMFCKPILKTPIDLNALQQVVLDGNDRFFLGTDSAPHTISKKECASGCAGVFSSPVTLSLITEFFWQHKYLYQDDEWIEKLENFCTKFGADYYGLAHNNAHITIAQEEWTVPTAICNVSPLCAGQILKWRVC